MMPVRLLAVGAVSFLSAGVFAAPPPRAEKPAAVDRYGDPLPHGAVARIGTVRLQHAGGVSCVAYSPDGKTLASVGGDRTIRFWDMITGREKRRFTCDVPRLTCIAFFPDGKRLATAGEELLVRIWDADTGKEVRRLPLPRHWCRTLAVSPDGKTLAGGSHDGLYLWDLTTTGELRHVNSANRGGLVKTLPFAFSGDSKRVAVAWGDRSVRLYEAATGKETGTRLDCREHVSVIAPSPDGKTLAAVAYSDPTVRLWDVASGKERTPLKGHRKEVHVVAFAPDGKTLASASWDETVRLWDVASGKERRQCKARPDSFNSLAFAPDGKTLAAAGFRGWIQCFDMEGEARRVSAEPPDGLRQVRFLPDGKTLISAGGGSIASGDGVSVRLWEAATGKEIRSLVTGTAKVSRLALSPDGRVVALAAHGGEDGNRQSRVSLCRVATGKELVRITATPFMGAFTPDGRTLIVACWKEGVRLWQVSTGKEIRRLGSDKTGFDILAVSSDGTMLAGVGQRLRNDGLGSSDRTVWL
jgi:WD40 repeat protein